MSEEIREAVQIISSIPKSASVSSISFIASVIIIRLITHHPFLPSGCSVMLYMQLADKKPEWAEQIENLVIALEMYRIEEDKAVKRITDFLTAHRFCNHNKTHYTPPLSAFRLFCNAANRIILGICKCGWNPRLLHYDTGAG